MAIDLQDRIRDLEQSLREERRAVQEAEERYRALELTGNWHNACSRFAPQIVRTTKRL